MLTKATITNFLDFFIPNWLTPNHLSILRIVGAVIILIIGLSPTHISWLLPIGIISGISDSLDGWLARRRSLNSNLGSFLDPIADKFFIVILLIVFWLRGLIEKKEILFIALTEIHTITLPILIGWRRRQKKQSLLILPKIKPNRWGKIKTIWLFLAMGFINIGTILNCNWVKKIGLWNLWIASFIGLLAIIRYFMDWYKGEYK